MINEEDFIFDIYSVGENTVGERHRVKITHQPTGESVEHEDRIFRKAHLRALVELEGILDKIGVLGDDFK